MNQQKSPATRSRYSIPTCKERGNVPNMFRTLARRPEVMKTASDHMTAIVTGSATDRKILELLAVRVSVLNECKY